jgi:hypothetical protein
VQDRPRRARVFSNQVLRKTPVKDLALNANERDFQKASITLRAGVPL